MDATDCKVTLCGLGAQGTKAFNTPKKLVKYAINLTQLRLFKMLSERAISIGVRGEFTAECLELMGIKNYRVIGCPSLFKHFNGVFPQIKRPTTENVQVGVTPGAPGSGKVIKLAERNDCIWVVQSQSEYPKYVNVCGGKILSPKWAVKNYGLDAINIREISNYFSKSNHVFWSIEDWNRFYSEQKVGFAFGTRFHGNMAALRNGIPALWVVHDSRTDELTKWLSLPRITYKEIEKVKSVDELFDYCDYSTLQSKYYSLCKNYIDFLEENGIEHRFNLKNL